MTWMRLVLRGQGHVECRSTRAEDRFGGSIFLNLVSSDLFWDDGSMSFAEARCGSIDARGAAGNGALEKSTTRSQL